MLTCASEELKFQNFLGEDSPRPPYKLAPFHQTSYAKNLDLCLWTTLVQTCQPPKGKKCEILNMEKSRAGKSSEKWVKSREMSQISFRGNFQCGL